MTYDSAARKVTGYGRVMSWSAASPARVVGI
jgi:hypothetical protein